VSVEGFMGALALAGNAVLIVGLLGWRRQRRVFWFTSTLIVVGVCYLVATGATENLARSIWRSGPFDPVKWKEFEMRAVRHHEKGLGLWLIGMPIGLVFIFMFWRRQTALIFATFLMSTCMLLLAMTSIPEALARLVFPDEILNAPNRQIKSGQQVR
jgi:hypothetical protein